MGLPPFSQTTIAPNYNAQTNARGLGLNVDKYAAFPNASIAETGFKRRASSDGRQSVEAEYLVPWGQGPAFERYALGYSDVILSPGTQATGVNSGTLTRQIPLQCPEPGYESLYASDCELIDPSRNSGACFQNPSVFLHDGANTPLDLFGRPIKPDPNKPADQQPKPSPIDWPYWIDGSTGKDGLARYRVVFTPARGGMIYRSDAELAALVGSKGELERYVIREVKCSVQNVALPPGVAFLSGPAVDPPAGTKTTIKGTTIPAASAFLLFFSAVIRYTWVDVPDVPSDNIEKCVGKVNDANFDGARGAMWRPLGFPAGTLMCEAPPSIVRKQLVTGRFVHDITYEFLYRPQGWNLLPASDGNFYPVGFAGGAPLYQSASFNTLFQMGPIVLY